MTSTSKKKARRPLIGPMERARRQANYIRLLAFLVAVMMLIVGLKLGLYPEIYLLGVAGLLAYPLIAQTILVIANRRDIREKAAHQFLMQLDAMLIGMTCALLHFALVPSLVLLIIVHANAVTSGGLKPWLLNQLMTTIGAVVMGAILGFAYIPLGEPVPVVMIVVSLLGLGIYVGASSAFAHYQARYLREAQELVRRQQQQAVELSRKLAKYLPPQIWGSIFSGKRDAKLETRRKRLTVFFSDIKGFSAISEELPLETLTSMLNTYLSEMTRIALRHGGTIDKFIGDAVMVFFGDPNSEGAIEDAYRCVLMGIEMQEQMKLLRQRWKREGIEHKLEIRIGINTGYVTVGNFGTDSRMDYTILGTDVNLASRLESACRPGGVLISEATQELVKDRIQCRNMGDIQVKGFNRPIPVFEAMGAKKDSGAKNRYVSAQTAGFGIHLDVERVRNFDKNTILKTLARSATELKKDSAVSVDYEAEGFSLHVDSGAIKKRERDRIINMMGQAAKRVQTQVRV
ncbi:adenylate/guanylate cyclase domain-containing protein [Alcanivorax sediminis]|uniref:Adenylate cyclase n=1 Tax=Alcanivorax sediminis TaxID=2663008 RepID=A0A6N7LWE3_9GAMM|nr:adenylate/guanylate cyclase domain-containing protein [Alcanivorax sediminis]MQX53514.1 adenylate cyclase [Alcanivorax sediminis]